ncbi:MAG: AbrB/MazE/SpoVT family DNA-binding domain-containing protein [Bacteroidales bacterium]|jgi:antitoxin MazE|nr:AbrB/MazE/SpoVT family DNA-binding domain-containing protein [Bacteroidales bacterium]
MEVSVVKIGNSRGIRFSKTILERYNIRDSVNLILEKGHIIIKPVTRPRKGWEKAFKEMHDNQDDGLLMPDVFDDEISEEWK